MNWLALAGAAVKLFTAIAAALRDRRLIAAGEARGRAESDAEHARTAAAREAAMRHVADHPPTRAEVERRLDQGNA